MLKKILLTLIALIVLATIGFFIFVQATWDKKYDWPGPNLKTSTDSTIIAHGKYLVNGPAHCVSCHVAGFPEMVASDAGENIALEGGLKFPMGPLGSIYSQNLTSDKTTGLGRYSDEQIFRMMRHGIRPDNESSIPLLMPFWEMADDDMVAIVSYLRTLAPVSHKIPDNEWTFIGKAARSLASTFKPIENPGAPAKAPAMLPTIERGEYLARYVANCVGCHTERDLMTYEAIGPEFAGGMEFEPWNELHRYLKVDSGTWIRTPNITPDPNSALSKFKTPEEFIKRFREGRKIIFSPMDWGPFSRMSDEDITALWMFLNSLKPVKKDVGELIYTKTE